MIVDSIATTCPWCFEPIEIAVEADVAGRFVQDCEVCCHPLEIRVERDDDGEVHASIERSH